MNGISKKLLACLGLISMTTYAMAQRIDREKLVKRHNVVVKSIDTLASLTVGNGKFAYTVDGTGMLWGKFAYRYHLPYKQICRYQQ